MQEQPFDFDYVVIGSGFGGSVSALRLAQKGYRVAVIESGKRWKPGSFAESNWNFRKSLWMPKISFYGIQRMHLLKHVLIISGAGVGGGSLNYANTHYIPPDVFFENPAVKKLNSKGQWLSFYHLAGKMLGSIQNPVLGRVDDLLKETAKDFNKGDTFRATDVGVFFGEKGEPSKDPYFFDEGPDRIGCELCGACMTGCNKDAKNTLDKNYLYFAEKLGVEILPERRVDQIIPLSENGDDGYEISSVCSTGILNKRQNISAKGIVVSAGVLGTLSLLMKMKAKGFLPRLSEKLGEKVRTNSEALIGVRSRSGKDDFSTGVAITSSVYPDDVTHIEPVRYGSGHDAMGVMPVLLTDGGSAVPRLIKYLFNILKSPFDFLRVLNPFGFARSAIILLVMQTSDNYINVKRKVRLFWPFKKVLSSQQAKEKINPAYIPIANEFARKLAGRMNAIACSSLPEVYLDIPVTAHVMGGCATGEKVGEGVIDEQNRVRGYENMLIVDGSMIPANLGVNPSLSITAFAERAMSFVPVQEGKEFQYLKAEKEWGVEALLNKS